MFDGDFRLVIPRTGGKHILGATHHEDLTGVISGSKWLIGKVSGHDGWVILVQNACDAVPPHQDSPHVVLVSLPAQ